MNDFDERLRHVLSRFVDGLDTLQSVSRLSGGASQETYRIDAVVDDAPRAMALRRAVGGEGFESGLKHAGLALEARLMELAREAGVPSPEILYVLQPEDGLGSGFLMEWIDGETLGAHIVRSPELAEVRPRLARECGRILARIHGIDVAATGLIDHLQTVSTEDFIQSMWTQYRACDTPHPMIDYTARWLLEHLPPPVEHTLVHNDFRNGNFIVTPDGIQALLDWELAHIGDPGRDLGWICTNSWRFGRTELEVGGFGTLDDLLAGYEAESGIRIAPERVHYWQVFGSFWWAIGCLTMARQWRNGPDRTVERAAVGRRNSECQADCVNLLIPGPVELIEPTQAATSVDMPRVDELVQSVQEFLRGELRESVKGRTEFLARVAANSLGIVSREMSLGPIFLREDAIRLRALLGEDGDVLALRRRLAERLRENTLALDAPGLAEYLRWSVFNQLAIDQPKYSALKTALQHNPSSEGKA